VRTSWSVIVLWTVVIIALILVEIAEITHLFTLPIESVFGDPLGLLFALVFTTILALVGAIFIGIYISARVLRADGFTPFEEEMLRMRVDVRELKETVERLEQAQAGPADAPAGGRK
jgi:hypothetical protein